MAKSGHIRMTCLAPRLIESILDGTELDGLSLEQLAGEIPVQWEEQASLFS